MRAGIGGAEYEKMNNKNKQNELPIDWVVSKTFVFYEFWECCGGFISKTCKNLDFWKRICYNWLYIMME